MEIKTKACKNKKELEEELETAIKDEECMPLTTRIVDGNLEIKFLKDGCLPTEAVEEIARQTFKMGKAEGAHGKNQSLIDEAMKDVMKGFHKNIKIKQILFYIQSLALVGLLISLGMLLAKELIK